MIMEWMSDLFNRGIIKDIKEYNSNVNELKDKILTCCESQKYCVIKDAMKKAMEEIDFRRGSDWKYHK